MMVIARLRKFVSLPFLIRGATMKQRGAASIAESFPGSYYNELAKLQLAVGDVWWQIGIALLGHEPEQEALNDGDD